MNITIIAVGNKMPNWVNEAFDDYAKRFAKDIQLELKPIRPEKRNANVGSEKGIAAENIRIMAALPARAYLVILDERGKSLSSHGLADSLKKWMDEGQQNIAFVIGGADGLSDELKRRANLLLQLSAMTLPHGMARILLVEQIYRAYSILNNHPYHRD